MHTTFGWKAGALLVAAWLLIAAGAGSAQSVPATLAGTWVHRGDREASWRAIDAAFAPSIAALPEILHGFARSRIRDGIPPPRRIVLAIEGTRVRASFESERPISVAGPIGGAATTAAGVEDGTRVTSHVQGGWLELRYHGSDSEMRQLFSTEPDGSVLHVDYSITGNQVRGTARYRLDYTRQP